MWENWYSLDALEITYSQKSKERKVVLYEVKTRNRYTTSILTKNWKFRLFELTQNTKELYDEAKKLGMEVKVAIVWLLSNWNYDVEIKDLDEVGYIIREPRKYDKQD